MSFVAAQAAAQPGRVSRPVGGRTPVVQLRLGLLAAERDVDLDHGAGGARRHSPSLGSCGWGRTGGGRQLCPTRGGAVEHTCQCRRRGTLSDARLWAMALSSLRSPPSRLTQPSAGSRRPRTAPAVTTSQAKAAAAPALGKPVTELLTVPACKGLAVKVAKGQYIKVINAYGAQARLGGTLGPWCPILTHRARYATSGASARTRLALAGCCGRS